MTTYPERASRLRSRVSAAALASVLVSLSCSDDGAPPASPVADSTLTSSSASDADLDCRNSYRSFSCLGEGCCTEQPACQEGRLPFDDACGCGCISSTCQPGNRSFLSTSPHECSTSVRLECDANEAPFSDECGCGCTDIVNLPEGCERPTRTFICVGRDCCAGIDWVCSEGTQGFSDRCGCGCEG